MKPKEYANIGLSIRVTKSVRRKLKELCEAECRSQAEQISYLILQACDEQGIK